MKMRSCYCIVLYLLGCLLITSCSKLIEVPEPINTITTNETFETEANANAAISGIYGSMSQSQYGSGFISRIMALSADELKYFDLSNVVFLQYQNNNIQAGMASGNINSSLWTPIYFNIYQANAAIEGLQASKGLPSRVKDQLTGEAKFLRAFCHFYLVNLFGDVPLVTTTTYARTDTMHRTPQRLVYDQIIKDLEDARNILQADYTSSSNTRTRVNKWVADALLARVYLFTRNYAGAEEIATGVINNSSLFQLESDPGTVFLQNSQETIWQLQVLNNYPWATQDGNLFIPFDNTRSPKFYLTNQLLQAFEPADGRRTAWLGSTSYGGQDYYYPFKYKVREGTPDNITEYYLVLRLAEQYLIRAEARGMQNKELNTAVADVNMIRHRAGLSDLPGTLTQEQLLRAVAQERRVELFSEWGHRWLDLKRTGQATAVLTPIKPLWVPTQALYPIPITELQVNPNLTQNDGYR